MPARPLVMSCWEKKLIALRGVGVLGVCSRGENLGIYAEIFGGQHEELCIKLEI